MKKIQLIGSEEDLDKGFYIIMTSNENSLCLRNEIYIVNEKVIELLNKSKVNYRLI